MADEPGTMRVQAVEGFNVPMVDSEGRTVMDTFVGRNRDGSLASGGVVVPTNAYFSRAVARGALKQVGDATQAVSLGLTDDRSQGVVRTAAGPASPTGRTLTPPALDATPAEPESTTRTTTRKGT